MMPAPMLTASMPLSELLQLILKDATTAVDPVITGLSVDSRTLQPGDLFLACAGYQVHAAEFIPVAVSAGAIAVLVEVMDPMEQGMPMQDLGVPCIPVFELTKKVGVLADHFYGHPSASMLTVGVTGTDGKTSCSHFIAQSIQQARGVCGLIGTLGYGLYGDLHEGMNTTPDALRLQQELVYIRDQQAQSVVMEVSSHALEQGRVNGVDFDIAVLTNLGRDHLDFHGDMEHYADAKKALFQFPNLSHVVINLDDEFGCSLLSDDSVSAAVTVYGLGSRQLTPVAGVMPQWIWADAIEMNAHGMCIQIHSSWGQGELRTPLLGRFNASNLLAALAVLLLDAMPFAEALQNLSRVTTVAGRMECFGGADKPLVVVDYAHTPGALEQVLKALREHCTGSLWCVFGAGGDRDVGKRPLMGKVAETYADHVVITDDNPRNEDATQIVIDILSRMQRADDVYIERDRAQAIEHAITCATMGDVVLVAGKGHETEQLIAGQRLAFSDKEQVLHCLQGGDQ